MASNTETIIEKMQASFPHIYNVYDKNTVLYALISTYGKRYGLRTDIIDRLYAMIGIDSTYDEDLEYRWGSLLRIYKQVGESYNDYRSRLKTVYSSLAGGTAESIKYAIASVIGMSSDPDMIDKYIKVYDAWDYDGEVPAGDVIDKSYGNMVCVVDLSIAGTIDNVKGKIMESICNVKASGTNPHIILKYTLDDSCTISADDDYLSDIVAKDCSHMVLSLYPHETLSFFTNEELRLLSLKEYLVESTFDAVDDYTWDEMANHTWSIVEEFGVKKKE